MLGQWAGKPSISLGQWDGKLSISRCLDHSADLLLARSARWAVGAIRRQIGAEPSENGGPPLLAAVARDPRRSAPSAYHFGRRFPLAQIWSP